MNWWFHIETIFIPLLGAVNFVELDALLPEIIRFLSWLAFLPLPTLDLFVAGNVLPLLAALFDLRCEDFPQNRIIERLSVHTQFLVELFIDELNAVL